MSFQVPAAAYDDFMGRYSRPLAAEFAAFAGVQAGSGWRVADVGCGPGALSEHLATLVGADHVAAADPADAFVQACAARVCGADVRAAPGESLPWADATFDACLSQLAVNFMQDPAAGAREMVRVTRPGGVVAACTWDSGGSMELLDLFWAAAHEIDPETPPDPGFAQLCTADELQELWESTPGLTDVTVDSLRVWSTYPTFDALWASLQQVGPPGAYCQSLVPEHLDAIRTELHDDLLDRGEPLTLEALAWVVRGAVTPRGV